MPLPTFSTFENMGTRLRDTEHSLAAVYMHDCDNFEQYMHLIDYNIIIPDGHRFDHL